MIPGYSCRPPLRDRLHGRKQAELRRNLCSPFTGLRHAQRLRNQDQPSHTADIRYAFARRHLINHQAAPRFRSSWTRENRVLNVFARDDAMEGNAADRPGNAGVSCHPEEKISANGRGSLATRRDFTTAPHLGSCASRRDGKMPGER